MTQHHDLPNGPHSQPGFNGWRIAGWGAAVALLALPAVAMRFTREINWTIGDFFFAAILLIALGVSVEIAVKVGRNGSQRLGIALAALTGFLTLWANAAVGFIGNEDEPVNIAFSLMVVCAAAVSLAVRFRPALLRWIYGVIALGQVVLGFVATATMPGHAVEWGVVAVFGSLWAGAALLSHRAVIR